VGQTNKHALQQHKAGSNVPVVSQRLAMEHLQRQRQAEWVIRVGRRGVWQGGRN